MDSCNPSLEKTDLIIISRGLPTNKLLKLDALKTDENTLLYSTLLICLVVMLVCYLI